MFEIGTTLRQARERQGITIAVAAESTKIRASYLRALEDETFDRLPGATYARGFLRSYAEYLGLDAQLLVDEYSARFTAAPWDGDDDLMFPRRGAKRSSQRPSRGVGVVVVALAGIVAVAVLVVIASTYPDTSITAVPTTSGSTTVVTVTEEVVNPMATAVTGDTSQLGGLPAPVLVMLKPLAQVTVTVRALGVADSIEPIFQGEIQPNDQKPEGFQLPRSSSGYLIRIDRPDTLELVVNGNPVVPGASDTLLSIDPDGRVAAVK